MTIATPRWLSEGRGLTPRVKWTLTTDAPLAAMDFAAEAGTLLVADQSGGLYRFDRAGKVTALSRGFHEIRHLAWADRGNTGTAVLGDNRVVFLAQDLSIEWSVELSETIFSTAIAPFGEHLLVSLANGITYLLRSDRKRIAKFETSRPIRYGRFLHSEPALVLAAEYGFVTKYSFNGQPQWEQAIWSNVGGMAVSSDGKIIALALYNHGIQKFTPSGESAGIYMVEGTPHTIGVSETGHRVAVGTLENHLYWIDGVGQMIWAATAPRTIRFLAVAPVGETMFIGYEEGRIEALTWN